MKVEQEGKGSMCEEVWRGTQETMFSAFVVF